MNEQMLPSTDVTERAKWLRRVLWTISFVALLGGIVGVVAVQTGEKNGVIGFSNATGFWGTMFLKRSLDTMTLNAALLIVSIFWFVYGTVLGIIVATLPSVVLWSIAYYAKKSQLADQPTGLSRRF
jgi:hypothetical protein